MKIKSLILAMVACAGLFTACSNELDEVTTDNGNVTTGVKDAYASVSFVMPNTGGGTRANENVVVGTDNENTFETVRILLFKDGVLLTDNKTLDRVNDFDRTTVDNKVVYTLKKASNLAVASGTYKVYVVLNPTKNLQVTENSTTLTDFQGMIETAAKGEGAYCTNGKFMMTNADVIQNTEILQSHTVDNAAKVVVNVERLAAKITFTDKTPTEGYSFTDQYGNKIAVAFDAFKVINTRNSAYNFRRVGMNENEVTIGGKENGSNYVIENQWAAKTTWSKPVFDANYSRRAVDTYVAFRKLTATSTESQTLAYCLENTMLKNMQLNGYSTGIIFRAKITVNGKTGDLYKYQGKFYTDLIKVAQSVDTEWDGTDNEEALKNLKKDVLNIKAGVKAMSEGKKTVTDYLASINNQDALHNTFGVDLFIEGYCYYKYWLRHNDNGDANNMGIMEFVIVRNNVYQVTIKSVAALGDFSSGTKGQPDPEDPTVGEEDNDPKNPNPEMPGEVVPSPEPKDPVVPIVPTDPDESNKTYLNVEIDILPWIVRTNDIVFE